MKIANPCERVQRKGQSFFFANAGRVSASTQSLPQQKGDSPHLIDDSLSRSALCAPHRSRLHQVEWECCSHSSSLEADCRWISTDDRFARRPRNIGPCIVRSEDPLRLGWTQWSSFVAQIVKRSTPRHRSSEPLPIEFRGNQRRRERTRTASRCLLLSKLFSAT
jgi:hypothetical protein